MKQLAPESKAFLVCLFRVLRRDLVSQVEAGGPGAPDPEAARRELAIFDALLASLAEPDADSHDDDVRRYVAELAATTDVQNEYERVTLEHRALAELADALKPGVT